MRRRRPNDNTERAPSFLQSVDTEQTPDIASHGFSEMLLRLISLKGIHFAPHHPAHFFVKPLSMGWRRAWQQAAVFCIRTSAHSRTYFLRFLLLHTAPPPLPLRRQVTHQKAKIAWDWAAEARFVVDPLYRLSHNRIKLKALAVIHGSSTQLSSEWWLHTHLFQTDCHFHSPTATL